MKLYLRKIGNVYQVDSGDDSNIKQGEIVSAEIKRPRNYDFHKKYFALLNYAFGVWEPGKLEYKGQRVGKSIDRFRKDVAILTGHYEIVTTIKGDVRAEAKSISFGSMGEDEFEKLFSETINVLIKHILTNYTYDDIDNVIENIVGFD